MALLFNHALACRTAPVNRARLQLGGLIVGTVITVEEFSQLWFSSRTFDAGDLLANWVGVLVAELLVRTRAR
jgi:glycopeptide antibiotics resistance protein